jgi:AcrR family transcriptional regulator
VARPRTITDERLLDALAQVITRVGPSFTVSDVAVRAGVSVGTVAQRFGSKQGLLKALSRAAVTRIRATVRTAAESAQSAGAGAGLAADPVAAAILAVYRDLDDPEAATHNLAQLATDMADPELRVLLGDFYATLTAELAELLRVADLPGAPPARQAARLLVSLANGTAIDWSIRPDGHLVERLASDLAIVLNGWRRDV